MDSAFFEELNKFFLIYIDDRLVFSTNFDDHLEHLDRILTKTKLAGLSLSVSKCKFGYQEVKLLGHQVGKDGFRMDPAKVDKIVRWPKPTCVTEISQFVGMIQYYRRYLRGLSEIISPMNQLKKKNVPFIWGPDQDNAFQKCKELLVGQHVLIHPDFTKTFILFTDASNTGIGGVLSQAEDGNADFVRPVYYGSKALTTAEKRTSIYEKEFLAIVYFIRFFKMYLIGNKFTVYTDQKSLQYLIKFNEEASAKVVRWQASLLAYDFNIIYRPGKLNANADALSRLPPTYSKGPELEEIIEDYHLPLYGIKHARDETKLELEEKKKFGEKNIYSNSDGMDDKEYFGLINFILQWVYPVNATEAERKAIKNKALSFEVDQGVLYKKAPGTFMKRRVLRCTEVVSVLKNSHDHLLAGHAGIKRTFDKIKEQYYWSGYYDTIQRYVLSCKTCQNFGPRNPPTPLTLNPKSALEAPFSQITMDYIYLPLTSAGYNAALVIVDKFTGWMECKPTSTQSSGFTCMALFEWICQYGLMVQVHCDNGPHFNAEEVKYMMLSSYGIQLRFGVPYHPQGQGKVERVNGVVKNIMKKYVLKYGSNWDMWLPAVMYVMRISDRSDHGYSPFFLVYGRRPKNIVEDVLTEDHTTIEDLVDQEEMLLERIRKVIDLTLNIIPKARVNIKKYKVKMISNYNKKTKEIIYKVGDSVMVLDRKLPGMSSSLLPQWTGPMCVAEVLGKDVYVIKDGELKLPYVFHANQMKLFRARPRLASNLKFYSKGKPVEIEGL